MGLIQIEGMEFFAYHGCFKEERVIGTRFLVDIAIEADTEEAEVTDDLKKTCELPNWYTRLSRLKWLKSHIYWSMWEEGSFIQFIPIIRKPDISRLKS